MAPQLGEELVGDAAADLGDRGGVGEGGALVGREARVGGVVRDGGELAEWDAPAPAGEAADVAATGAAVEDGDEPGGEGPDLGIELVAADETVRGKAGKGEAGAGGAGRRRPEPVTDRPAGEGVEEPEQHRRATSGDRGNRSQSRILLVVSGIAAGDAHQAGAFAHARKADAPGRPA